MNHIKAELDAKRLEIEEKRNEELLQSYLKAKNMRVIIIVESQ